LETISPNKLDQFVEINDSLRWLPILRPPKEPIGLGAAVLTAEKQAHGDHDRGQGGVGAGLHDWVKNVVASTLAK
jgi:hypothetical protein